MVIKQLKECVGTLKLFIEYIPYFQSMGYSYREAIDLIKVDQNKH
ncbi:hypothetical protein SD78_1421 [Bacillus badius]|nr:hypothetical protein SD78_1421 [Bacillus badius]